MARDDDSPDLRPIAQTEEAFGLLDGDEGRRLEKSVLHIGRRVREISPSCIAVSVSVVESALTFTVVASNKVGTYMDAMQYLDGGPCLDSAEEGELLASHAPTDESRWFMFAKAGRHLGIESTLSLPVLEDGNVVATVNLYGETSDAFDGRHEELASVCGAWASNAVTNADLGFTSAVQAAAAPDRLMSHRDLDLAAGVVSVARHLDLEEARSRISRAARLAGVSSPEFARFVLDSHNAGVGR
jgi:GAF domain-containing protein